MFHLSENIPMADVKRPSVRRRLPFTDPDPSKAALALDNQEKEINENEAKRFKEQWGFDVNTGQPVQGGNFDYSVIEPSTAPAFYFKSYAPRKLKKSYDFINVVRMYPSSRPQSMSAKRKLDLDLDLPENDENVLSNGHEENSSLQFEPTEPLWNANGHGSLPARIKASAKHGSTSSSSVVVSSPSSPSSCTDGQSRLCESPLDDSNGLSRSTSLPTLSLSPATKEKDFVTPPTRSKSLTAKQSTIKDFLPLHKKPRISSKALPRQ